MANVTSPIDPNELAVLQIIAITGTASRSQIQTYLAHPRNIASLKGLSGPAWTKGKSRQWTDKVLAREFAAVLPSPGRHYSGQNTGRQIALELTPTGKQALKAAGLEPRQVTFTEPTAVHHALAMLDVRTSLLSLPDIGTVDTDIDLGEVRPDNVAKWSDGNKRWILFESEQQADRSTEPRIRRKLHSLARFFLSGDGSRCDPAVRIIYLWKPMDKKDLAETSSHAAHRHEIAMNAWMNACYAVRVQMPGRILPFNLYFLSHAQFLAHPDTPLGEYEYLPGTGADLPPLPSADGSPDPNNDETNLDGADEEALAWILGFNREVRRGIDTKRQQKHLVDMYSSFLDNHPKLRIAYQRLIGAFVTANGADAPRRLEQIGAELLRNLGFPSLPPGIDGSSDEVFPIQPVGIAAPGEAPKLTFVITQARESLVKAACPAALTSDRDHWMDTLSKALSLSVRYAVQERVALDLVGGDRLTSKRQKKKAKS